MSDQPQYATWQEAFDDQQTAAARMAYHLNRISHSIIHLHDIGPWVDDELAAFGAWRAKYEAAHRAMLGFSQT